MSEGQELLKLMLSRILSIQMYVDCSASCVIVMENIVFTRQDMQSVQYEVNPLCVLDFYVHESRQRTGCGKRLFEHMLKVCLCIQVISS